MPSKDQWDRQLADVERGLNADAYGYGKDFRAPRECKRCGYVRTVKVTPRTRNGQIVPGDEMTTSYCTACSHEIAAHKAERSAAKHRAEAKRLREGYDPAMYAKPRK